MKLRSHILVITAATLLPLLAFVCLALVLHFESGRAAQLQSLVSTSRALSLALDKDFEIRSAALRTLAQSAYLREGDFKLFHAEAKRVLAVHEGADAIVLVEPSGQQAMNTRRAFGERLSLYSDPSFITTIVQSRKPAVSNLFISRAVQRPVISVGVPVIIDGDIEYALTMSLSPAFIQRLLEQQALPAQWLSTIIDANKIIVARTKDVEKLRGQPASRSLSANSAEAAEGWWIGRPSGSENSYVAHRRSNVSGWTVAIAVPVSSVNQPLWQALGLIMGGIVFFLAVAAGITAVFWRRIVSSINALAKGATALRQGKAPEIQGSAIVELDQVKRELEAVAADWKNAADGLHYQQRLFEKLTGNIAEPVFITDADGRIKFVNARATAIFGFGVEDLLGRPLQETLHKRCASGDSLPERRCEDAAAGLTDHQDVLLHKDGTPLIVRCTHVPLEVDGRCVSTILIVRDIAAHNRLHTEMDEPSERRA